MSIDDRLQLFAAMQANSIVITPNNRLSNALLAEFTKISNRSVAEKPRCLSYSAFLHSYFKQLCYRDTHVNHPLLLSASQLSYLWRQIIAESNNHFANEGLFTAVEEAWRRCQLWKLDINDSTFFHSRETRIFQQWAQTLENKLLSLGALTEEQLVNYLIKQSCLAPEKLIWACFDDYTPQQKALQEYFLTHNYSQYHYDLNMAASNCEVYAAENMHKEQLQLSHWLAKCLARGDENIGVVVPDLQAQSKSLQHLLQQQLPNEQFNISLGKPLTEYPLVVHALDWLELDGKSMSSQQARLLLHSPYLGDSKTEMLARSQLLEDSQVLNEQLIDQTIFQRKLEKVAPKMAARIGTITPYPAQATLKSWISQFKMRLAALGFPGEYRLNSAMYQCYQRFLLLFDEFQQLALLTPFMTQAEALRAFKHLAQSTIFQPKSSKAAKVQILGLLEASGCLFDRLWVTGMTAMVLPQKTKPSAFIPLKLQKQHQMPHANPERELFLAKTIIHRLCNSSPCVIFSYPQYSADSPNQISPLLSSFPSSTVILSDNNVKKSILESIKENYLVSFIENEQPTGGSALLANQAKCPFRAFAAHRLHAQSSPPLISDGPDARQRGQIIHKILELLWAKLQNQQALLALTEKELDTLLENTIDIALAPIIADKPYSFSLLVQEVEGQRLKRLVKACLEWEQQRPTFSVEAVEKSFEIELANLRIHIRVDRIDQIENNKKWLIDYKTSFPNSLPWLEERPKEPQLLLYALLDEAIKGLLFCQIKNGQFLCKGLSEENAGVLGVAGIKKDKNWQEYRAHWHGQLEELANEFSQGFCEPKPAGKSICQQCDYQSLCRFEIKEEVIS